MQVLGGVVVMMKVNLHFTVSCAAELGQGIHVFGLIFIDRKKERVPRWPTVVIPEVAEEHRVFFHPAGNPLARHVGLRFSPAWLVVISDTEQ
jgi:hypothetical protein